MRLRFALPALCCLVLAPAASGQCQYLLDRCSGGFIRCFGEPNLGCPSFVVIGEGFSTAALSSVALVAFCNQGAPLYLYPPVTCGSRCTIYPEIPAVILPLSVAASGQAYKYLPVPHDTSVFGMVLCAQFVQFMSVPGSPVPCIEASNGLRIRIGSGFCR